MKYLVNSREATMKIEGGRMTNTRDYIVFDRTGTPHAVVGYKTETGENCQQSGNREVEEVHHGILGK